MEINLLKTGDGNALSEITSIDRFMYKGISLLANSDLYQSIFFMIMKLFFTDSMQLS